MSQFLAADEVRAMGFRAVGGNVLIHRTANIVFPERMTLGHDIRIDAFVNLIASAGISFGNYIHVASYVYMTAGAEIELGDFSSVSQGAKLYTASDDYSGNSLTNPTVPVEYRNAKAARISLGRHAIIGAGSIVMPGVEVGEGAAVGAMSLVKASLAPWGVYAGVPAVFLKERSKKLLELERKFLGDGGSEQ